MKPGGSLARLCNIKVVAWAQKEGSSALQGLNHHDVIMPDQIKESLPPEMVITGRVMLGFVALDKCTR